ncbi:hypothetical protein OUZ56_029728 [Daphnia magna]|uniref:Uncharacterized protein n=1 Tax=Daphnia magna TaxID=35525 RepID=A0ABR0B831_9CRUS|nr:hypothetical protein OUZ56_029728 [Daphnia magna]
MMTRGLRGRTLLRRAGKVAAVGCLEGTLPPPCRSPVSDAAPPSSLAVAGTMRRRNRLVRQITLPLANLTRYDRYRLTATITPTRLHNFGGGYAVGGTFARRVFEDKRRRQTLKVLDEVTAETIANATKTLKDDIVAQGGNTRTLDSLLQQLHTLHGKEKEFLFDTISVLQKESVIALIEDKKQISTLKFELSNAQKQLKSNKRKAKSSKYTLSSSLEQLQENNEALKNSLEKANSQIADLEQNLETTLATESQLQNLLKRKEENNAAVETEGQEIINKLEGEKTRLIQKLSTAENQIKQVSETAEQLQKEIKVLADRLDKASTEKINLKKNLLDFTSMNKNLEKDLQELQDRVRGQENQITFLEYRVKEYKKLQVKFIETEESNDSRLDEDEPGEITKRVGDINELTFPIQCSGS